MCLSLSSESSPFSSHHTHPICLPSLSAVASKEHICSLSEYILNIIYIKYLYINILCYTFKYKYILRERENLKEWLAVYMLGNALTIIDKYGRNRVHICENTFLVENGSSIQNQP